MINNNKPPLKGRLSSKEIDDLIAEYRDGDMEAAEKLLSAFKALIGKYLKLFFSGSYNPNDSDIVKFISACGSKDITFTADIIKKRLRKYEAEELIHVCQIALLETAKFHDNIYTYYKYILHGYIVSLLIEDFPTGLPVMVEPDIEIDSDWINGITSGVGFCKLSDSQRLLVKMAWYDNIPDIHICRFLGLTASQLLKEKEIIKDLLARERNINYILGKKKKRG